MAPVAPVLTPMLNDINAVPIRLICGLNKH